MPDPDSVDQSDDSVLGDAPVNENLENVEPADAAGRYGRRQSY